MFLLLLFQESTKSVRLYVACFQSSAGRPQAGDRILCSLGEPFRAEGRRGAGFRDSEQEDGRDCGSCIGPAVVKILRKARRTMDPAKPASQERDAEAGSPNRQR